MCFKINIYLYINNIKLLKNVLNNIYLRYYLDNNTIFKNKNLKNEKFNY